MVGKRRFVGLFVVLLLGSVSVVSGDVVPRDFLTEVSKGNVEGHSLVTVRSYSNVIGTTEQIIWCLLSQYAFPSSATLMNVSSSDVDDVVGGAGVWNVTVSGLDADWVEQTETVQLNGQTPVSTTKLYIRVNKVQCVKSGSSGFNEGTVYVGVGAVTAGVPATTYNLICAEYGLSSTGLYSVPVNHTAYLLWGQCGTADNKIVAFIMKKTNSAISDGSTITMRHGYVMQDYVYFNRMYAKLPSQTDYTLNADAASADTQVEFNVKMLLIDDDFLHDYTLAWGDGSAGSLPVTGATSLTVSNPENQIMLWIGILVAIALGLAVVASRRRW